jgi:hypothetical protein
MRSSGGWAVCPGGGEGGENGRFFPVDGSSPRIITPTTPSAASVFARNTQVGVCHWNEQGLEAMYRALSNPLVFSSDDPRTPLAGDGNDGFLREEAKLAIIAITDEEDFSPQPVAAYETFLRELKGGDSTKVIFSAIAGPKDLSTCSKASSLRQPLHRAGREDGRRGGEHLHGQLGRLAGEALGERLRPQPAFPLSEKPSDTSRLVVRVDGVEVKNGWAYDAKTNTVTFERNAAPQPGPAWRSPTRWAARPGGPAGQRGAPRGGAPFPFWTQRGRIPLDRARGAVQGGGYDGS